MCKVRPVQLLGSELLPRREKLLNFIQSKVSNLDLAEDILQDSLLKALKGIPNIENESSIVPWFYQIMRNRIIDHYRRNGTKAKNLEKLIEETNFNRTEEEEKAVCECFRDLLPDLKPEYAKLIEEMELGNEPPEVMANRLGISRNNLKVRRYRARQQLQERLEVTCGKCAEKGCVDCQCK